MEKKKINALAKLVMVILAFIAGIVTLVVMPLSDGDPQTGVDVSRAFQEGAEGVSNINSAWQHLKAVDEALKSEPESTPELEPADSLETPVPASASEAKTTSGISLPGGYSLEELAAAAAAAD